MKNRKELVDYRDMMIEKLYNENYELPSKWDKQFTMVKQADDYICSNRFTDLQIVKMLIGKFNITRQIANLCIADANYVFAHSKKINKTTELYLHIQRIKNQIIQAEEEDKAELLPKLNDSLTKAIALYPEDLEDKRPTQLIINVQKNDLTVAVMDSATALHKLNALVNEMDGK